MHHWPIIYTEGSTYVVFNDLIKWKVSDLYKTAKNIRSLRANARQFNMLPKIHKLDNPGRSVIRSVNYLTIKISQYVDHSLQPHGQENKITPQNNTRKHFHLQFTFALIITVFPIANTAWVISGPYFPGFGLNTEIFRVNLRIQSKYRKTRTRNNSVFGHFSRSGRSQSRWNKPKTKNLLSRVIISFLRLILTLNNFIFNCTNFLPNRKMRNDNKIRSNICKHLYESIGRKHMYRFIKGKVKLFVIHIDDTFFIWTGYENDPQQVISKINEVHLHKVWFQLLKNPN